MSRLKLIHQRQDNLIKKYKDLVEEAYNLRQTNHELSDFAAYKALKILNKLNKLQYISAEKASVL